MDKCKCVWLFFPGMLLKIMPGHHRQPEIFPLITMNAIWPGPIFTSESSKHFENGVNQPWTHQNYRGRPSVERCYRQFTALDYSLQQLVALYILSVTISSVSQVESSTSFGFRVSYFYFLFLFSFFFRCRQHDWLAVSLHNLRRTWNYVPRVHFAALHTWQSTTG